MPIFLEQQYLYASCWKKAAPPIFIFAVWHRGSPFFLQISSVGVEKHSRSEPKGIFYENTGEDFKIYIFFKAFGFLNPDGFNSLRHRLQVTVVKETLSQPKTE